MKKIIYHRFGKKFRKIERNEIIKKGAMQSWCGGELRPIKGWDTVDDKPSSFNEERDFYNLVDC